MGWGGGRGDCPLSCPQAPVDILKTLIFDFSTLSELGFFKNTKGNQTRLEIKILKFYLCILNDQNLNVRSQVTSELHM